MSDPIIPSLSRYEWARVYLEELHLKPVPCAGKRPLVPWQKFLEPSTWPLLDELDLWFNLTHKDANIGAILAGSDLGIVDLDGDGAGRLLRDAGIDVSGHPYHETGRGGLVYWVRGTAGLTDRIAVLSTGQARKDGGAQVDFRARGNVLLPPSIHPATGKPYEWRAPFMHPSDVPEIPAPLRTLLEAEPVEANATPPLDVIPEGQRERTLTKVLGAARRQGATEADLLALALSVNARCVPPLSHRDLERVVRSMTRYAPDPDITEADITHEVPASAIRWRTAREICQAAPERLDYVVEPFLVAGCITDLAGAAKDGKSTFRNYVLTCAVEGASCLGYPAAPATSVVVITEEPEASLVEGLIAAGLHTTERVQITTLYDVRQTTWPDVIAAAVTKAKDTGARLLVVDTVPGLARLEGDNEDSAGAVLQAMRPLQEAAGQGLALLLVRHHRKAGGNLIEAGRGSSAFAGAVDVLISLRRPKNARPTVRLLEVLGRFRSLPTTLTVDRIHVTPSHSDLTRMESIRRVETFRLVEADEALGITLDTTILPDVVAVLGPTPETALTVEETATRVDASESSVRRALETLEAEGRVRRVGTGKRGDALRFYCHQLQSLGVGANDTNSPPGAGARAPPRPPRPDTRG